MVALPKLNPQGRPWAMLTAYDALMAAQAEAGGADLLLVGDSVGKAILGYEDESEVSLQDMVHHSKAVMRGVRAIPVVADLPYATYDDEEMALNSAQALFETGVDFIKFEGYKPGIARHLVRHDIPVFGHLGYTPQTAARSGSKVVGNTFASATQLIGQAMAMQEAGLSALVLEMVPREVSFTITSSLKIPVIGIGSGPDTDGQVLVITDMWGESDVEFKFLKKFGEIGRLRREAAGRYVDEVHNKTYPTDANSFHILKNEKSHWLQQHGREGQD